MAVIERSFSVAVPQEEVFAFLSDHSKDPQWLPGLETVENITGAGTDYHWEMTYKMAGVSFHVIGQVTTHEPPNRHVVETRSGMVSTWDWTLEPEGEGTRVSLRLEYKIPTALGGKIAEKLLLKQNEKMADEGVANLRRVLEQR